MEIDHQRHASRKTGVIPPAYAHLLLPGHQPEVEQGSFGILISQWLYLKEYNICVNHFEFRRPTSLKIIVQPCTTFYFAIQNTPVIYKGTLIPDIVTVKEGSLVKLAFLRSSARHKVKFQKGNYTSLHITIPEENAHILNDESWVWDLLEQYDKKIYKQ
jgi:hypothetical protein